MIHTLETLTIARYGKIERTKKIGLFKKPWNILPIALFNITPLITEIGMKLDSGMDRKLAKEKARLITWNKILILETLKMAIYALIVTKPGIDQWKITKPSKQIIKDLGDYIVQVKDITGLHIKDIPSLGRLAMEIQRRKIKFHERYNLNQEKDGEEISFTKYAYSVFMITEENYNPDTPMAEFFELLELADSRAKELEKMKRKNHK